MKNELERYFNYVLKKKREKHIKLAQQRRQSLEQDVTFRAMAASEANCNDFFANCCGCCPDLPAIKDCPTNCGPAASGGDDCPDSYTAAVSGLTGECVCGNKTITINKSGAPGGCIWSNNLLCSIIGGPCCCFSGNNLAITVSCAGQTWTAVVAGGSYDKDNPNDCLGALHYAGSISNTGQCIDDTYSLSSAGSNTCTGSAQVVIS